MTPTDPNIQRYVHPSPPVKQRKALGEAGSKVNLSPHFSKMASPKLSIKQGTTNIQRPTKISFTNRRASNPAPSFGYTNSAAHVHLRSISEASTRTSSIAQPAHKTRKSTTYTLQDPDAIKRQLQNQERLSKLISVEQDKIGQLEKKIADSRSKNDELETRKASLARSISEFKTNISTTEAELINVDANLERAKKVADSKIAHEEQMLAFEIKKYQQELIKQLDEFESEAQRALADTLAYRDEEGEKEIIQIQNSLKGLKKEAALLKANNEVKYDQEREKLEDAIQVKLQTLEKECEDLTMEYEQMAQSMAKSDEDLRSAQHDVDTLTKEIESTKKDITQQEQIKCSGESTIEDLMKKIEQLEKENSQIDMELEQARHDAEAVDHKYQESASKIHKELQFKRRIENSIQDLLGKLRVYIRVLPSESSVLQISQPEDDPSHHILTLKGDSYHFNKIFVHDSSHHAVSMESSTICESALNGCNVSFIVSGIDDESLAPVLLKQCLSTLQEREGRYKTKGWSFDYGIQVVSITPEGVFDTFTSSPAEIKLENRSIISSAKTSSIDQIKNFATSENSSTFIKISITATSPTKSFNSALYIFNLSRIESFDLIHNTTTKISQNKFSTAEFEHSMYQLVHSLYSNTKALTLCNIEDSESEETIKWLELAKFVSTVNGAPVKRVYSKIP